MTTIRRAPPTQLELALPSVTPPRAPPVHDARAEVVRVLALLLLSAIGRTADAGHVDDPR